MQSHDTPVTPGHEMLTVLNIDLLEDLRKANGIESLAALSRTLEIDGATLFRVMSGRTAPSNHFITRVRIAFPHVKLEALFPLGTKLVKIAA